MLSTNILIYRFLGALKSKTVRGPMRGPVRGPMPFQFLATGGLCARALGPANYDLWCTENDMLRACSTIFNLDRGILESRRMLDTGLALCVVGVVD